MSKQLQLRRGTTAEHSTFTGAVGELTVDTTKDTVVVHDGATLGGSPMSPQATTYTKTESDSLLDDKADQSTTYTKTEVDDIIIKADKTVLVPEDYATINEALEYLTKNFTMSYKKNGL